MNRPLLAATMILTLAACDDPVSPAPTQPDSYDFTSSFETGASSVSYGGQTARQVLISDLTTRIGGLTAAIDGATWPVTTEADAYSYLDYYVHFDGAANGDDPVSVSTTPAVVASEATQNGISAGKDLIGKLAGNDTVTDHKDWNSTDFTGWSDTSIAASGGSIASPAGLLESFLRTLAQRAIARTDGTVDTAPDGTPLPVHVTPDGRDLQQLTQKFLLMAINYSQGTDDYLDSDVDGKGLRSAQVRDGDNPYTKLEHAWDEGFGYFGASRDYGDYTDDELAKAGGRDGWQGYHDTDGDGAISLKREFNFSASINAAKRDRGAVKSATPTDFTGRAWDAFLAGRHVIATANGAPLSSTQMAALEKARDNAVQAWEGALAATCVHYVNDVLADIAKFGADYSFLDYAKHWSELKGFALGLQFNPRSRLSAADFATLHKHIADAPVLPTATDAEVTAYQVALRAARDLLMSSYNFPADLKGDDDGAGGW